MEFFTPPSALLNGDIQIYKWVWWRSCPWKIISSFAINERNSSWALCPLQTQFSNEKRCAPSLPPTATLIHLSSAHPRELWGIHSFKCWFQGPGLRIETHAQLTIFRMKEWDARIYFGVGLAGPGCSHTLLHMLCCWKWTYLKTIINKTMVCIWTPALQAYCLTCRIWVDA